MQDKSVGDVALGANAVEVDVTQGGVAIVTMRRPERANAFDEAMIARLTEVFQTLEVSGAIRLLFLKGSGGQFCAGGDLDWMRRAAGWTHGENVEDARALADMLATLHRLPFLTVALVEGVAFGGGAGLVAACDMAVATRDARFRFSEVRLGLTPATISPFVIEAIGPRAARALFASAQEFDAQRACALGLVSEVVESAEGFGAAIETLAQAVMANSPQAVAKAKQLVADFAQQQINPALAQESARRIADQRASPEGREGIAAFLERRKPNWAG